MGISKNIQDAIKTIAEQTVHTAPFDKTRTGVVQGIDDKTNTYTIQVDGVVYSKVRANGGIIPEVGDTVSVVIPTNNVTQMMIIGASSNSWANGVPHIVDDIVNDTVPSMINSLVPPMINSLVPSLVLDLIYPVGIYYWTSDANFNPNSSFNGTWRKMDEGITLVSAGTTYYTVDPNDSPTADGGEATVTLTEDEMPSHTHSFQYAQYNRGTGNATTSALQYTGKTKVTNSTGGGQPHNNMPPYKAAYCWHRIS